MTARAAHLPLCVLVLTLLLSACSSPQLQTGEDAEVSFDGLTKVDHTAMDNVWLKADDLPFDTYSSVIILPPELSFKPVKESSANPFSSTYGGNSDFPISTASKQKLFEIVNDAITNEISKASSLPLASEPGPDVAVIRIAFIDIVSHVPPATVGRSDVFISEIGSAALVIEIYDSQTNTILARGIDHKDLETYTGTTQLQWSNPVNNWREIRLEAEAWSKHIVKSLEKMMRKPK